MESGFNATAIDLAKIGRLFLREGDWDGDRILSRDWVRASIEPDSAAGRARYGTSGGSTAEMVNPTATTPGAGSASSSTSHPIANWSSS